jgi:hypothetical protein
MMTGTYRFYQNGHLVRESQNLLTEEGRRAILRYLAGRGGSVGDSIALGTGITPATTADSRLTFEVDRVTIDVVSVLYNDSLIVFKGTIPQEIAYSIYEAGLFNMPSNPFGVENSRILVTFEDNLEEWSVGSIVNTNARVGVQSLRLQPSASGTLETSASVVADLSNFTVDDNFTVAFTKASTNASSLILKFKDVNANQFALTKSLTGLPLGYNVLSFRKGDFVITGAMDWANVVTISLAHSATAGGASDLYLDGVRIEDDDVVGGDYALLSRSVLSTPVIKTDASPMDIEYALELNFA